MLNSNYNRIFENLFVLEAANNHWGDLERGKRIIQEFATVVRHNNVKAAIKFQFRDVDNFIHDEFKGNQDIRYIKKTEATRMSNDQYAQLANYVVKAVASIVQEDSSMLKTQYQSWKKVASDP